MKKLLLACTVALFVASCSQPVTTTETISLFNGKDLTGWSGWLSDSTLNPAGEFTVVDSVINLSGKFGYIETDSIYSDYTLDVEWRWVDTATNSGIFLHVQPEHKQWPEAYECQLWVGKAGDLVNSGGSTCAEYKADSTKMIVPMQNPSSEKPTGEWNAAQIICDGDQITVYINGQLQNKITGTSLTSGRIGLQSEGEAIQFRNVKLTPIKKQ